MSKGKIIGDLNEEIEKLRDLNIKRNKEKNQGKGMWHVGKREEASSFLKIRFRVIRKKRKTEERGDILE